MAQVAENIRGAVIARDPLDTNGQLIAAAGKPVKLMRLTLVGEEESIEEEDATAES